jgi:HEAT repeat protein
VAALLVGATARADGADELPGLLRALVSGSVGESNHAIDRLRYLGPGVAGPPLRALLTTGDERAREAASSALVAIHDKGSAEALEHALKDEDWEVRRNAVNALANLKARHATHAIEDMLKSDEQVRVRKACVPALAALNGSTTVLAGAAVGDAALEVRLAALDALAHAMDRHVAGKLRPLLDDTSSLIRFAAARALAWQDDKAARKFLTEALDSGDPEQAHRAVTALSDVPSTWAVDLLAHMLEGDDEQVGCDAAAALARREDPRGAHYLLKVATSGGPQAQKAQSWLDQLHLVDSKDGRSAGMRP